MQIFRGNPLLFIIVFLLIMGLIAVLPSLLRGETTIKQIFKMKTTWLIIGALGIGFGSIWAIVYLSVWFENRQVAIETAEAPAEIISHESVTKSRRQGGTERSYLIKYRYNVNGKVYEREFETSAGGKYSLIIYAPKDKLKACYNPADPSESHLWENRFKCGGRPDW